MASGRVAEAAEAWRRRTDSIQPVETNLELGRVQRQLQQISEATERFQQAVERRPNSAEAYAELGRTLFGQADYEAGVKMLQRAVQLAPENANYHFDVGLAMAQVGDFDSAVKAFDQAIELRSPDYADAYNARGNVYWNAGKSREAQTDFDRALKLVPEHG